MQCNQKGTKLQEKNCQHKSQNADSVGTLLHTRDWNNLRWMAVWVKSGMSEVSYKRMKKKCMWRVEFESISQQREFSVCVRVVSLCGEARFHLRSPDFRTQGVVGPIFGFVGVLPWQWVSVQRVVHGVHGIFLVWIVLMLHAARSWKDKSKSVWTKMFVSCPFDLLKRTTTPQLKRHHYCGVSSHVVPFLERAFVSVTLRTHHVKHWASKTCNVILLIENIAWQSITCLLSFFVLASFPLCIMYLSSHCIIPTHDCLGCPLTSLQFLWSALRRIDRSLQNQLSNEASQSDSYPVLSTARIDVINTITQKSNFLSVQLSPRKWNAVEVRISIEQKVSRRFESWLFSSLIWNTERETEIGEIGTIQNYHGNHPLPSRSVRALFHENLWRRSVTKGHANFCDIVTPNYDLDTDQTNYLSKTITQHLPALLLKWALFASLNPLLLVWTLANLSKANVWTSECECFHSPSLIRILFQRFSLLGGPLWFFVFSLNFVSLTAAQLIFQCWILNV